MATTDLLPAQINALRDEFAASVLTGIFLNRHRDLLEVEPRSDEIERLVDIAYIFADAMLARR